MMNSPQASTEAAGVRFRANPGTVAQRLGDEVVLVQINTDKIFVLNRTGARLWELLSSGLDRADVQQRMLQEFDVTEDRLTREVDLLVASLRDERLIDPA
jgi:hypothetical protein